MNIKTSCTKEILIAATAALVAGVVLGMLFAPDTGRVTRKKILSTAGGLGRLSPKKNDFPESEMEMDAINGDLFSR